MYGISFHALSDMYGDGTKELHFEVESVNTTQIVSAESSQGRGDENFNDLTTSPSLQTMVVLTNFTMLLE